jgi:hypothetical protein
MKFNNQDRQCVVTLSPSPSLRSGLRLTRSRVNSAKGLSMGSEMLRFAQHDNAGFGR